MHVTLRQMQIGKKWTITETFRREHQIASKFMRHPDFTEGVSAQLIKKPRETPRWQPASLEDIKPEDNVAEPFFETDKKLQGIKFLQTADYAEYPYNNFGLPSEREIENLVMEGTLSRGQVVKHFADKTKGKAGVKEVVSEVLHRKTEVNEDGTAAWRY